MGIRVDLTDKTLTKGTSEGNHKYNMNKKGGFLKQLRKKLVLLIILLFVLGFSITCYRPIMLLLTGYTWQSYESTMEWELFEQDFTYIEKRDNLFNEKYKKAIESLGFRPKSYLTVVDISEQKEYIFDKEGKFVKRYSISTGTYEEIQAEVCREGECKEEWIVPAMKPDVWRISKKVDSNLASIYGARLMMLEKRVNGVWYRTKLALHGTDQEHLIGTPFTLGCIYHKNVDIIELFGMLEVGDYVVTIE